MERAGKASWSVLTYRERVGEASWQLWSELTGASSFCSELTRKLLTTYHEKKHRKFTCESCITINTDIKKHVEHFEELLGNKTSGITKTENSYESMKITFEDLQDKIINSLEKSQADSQEMLHLEQKLLQTQSQNIMLEKKVEDLEKSNKELNNDYISVHQAYNTLLCEHKTTDTQSKTRELLMRIDEIEQEKILLNHKLKTVHKICDDQTSMNETLYKDIYKKNQLLDEYKHKCSELEDQIIKEKDKFLEWNLQINSKIDTKLRETLDELNDDSTWEKVSYSRNNKRKENTVMKGSDIQKETPIRSECETEDKSILILGNSLTEPINTSQFTHEFKVEKYIVYTADEAKNKLRELQPKKYCKILIHLITNDVKNHTVNETVEKMTTLISDTCTLTNSVIVSLGPPRSDNDEWKLKTEEVNIKLTSIYNSSNEVKISSNANLGSRGNPIKRFYKDGVHLTQQGTAVLVSNMKESLGIKRPNMGRYSTDRNIDRHFSGDRRNHYYPPREPAFEDHYDPLRGRGIAARPRQRRFNGQQLFNGRGRNQPFYPYWK